MQQKLAFYEEFEVIEKIRNGNGLIVTLCQNVSNKYFEQNFPLNPLLES